MTSLHEKSPCCRGKVIRFGGRRRQCVLCRKTWRAWRRSRGRNKKRISKDLLKNFLNGHFVSIQKESARRHVHESALRRRLVSALKKYATESWSVDVPDNEPVVLLADAVVKRIKRKWWTIYFVSVKPARKHTAILIPPVISKGRESYEGWKNALNAIPENTHSSVVALVCDGHRGLVYYAKWSGWHMQRCQAHLLFSIAGRRSQSPWSRHREEGRRLYLFTKRALTETNHKKFVAARDAVEEMGWLTNSRQLKRIISGFMSSVDDFRTYLAHPELDIPPTNNAMESFISQFQELCHRARGFATIQSLTRWTTAFTKIKKQITCNGFYQPN